MENKRIVLLAHFYRAAWSRWNSIESTDAANIWSLSKHWQIDNIGHRLFKRINQHEAPSDYHLNGSHYHCSVYNVSYSIWQAQLYRPSGHFCDSANARANTNNGWQVIAHHKCDTTMCRKIVLCNVLHSALPDYGGQNARGQAHRDYYAWSCIVCVGTLSIWHM